MPRVVRLTLFVALCSLWATPTVANDAVFGGEGADLVPLKQTTIRMLSEDIVLVKRTGEIGGWDVTATYRFLNPGDEPETVQIGFPERGCNPADGGDCPAGDGRFQNLVTTVRGARVATREGAVSKKEHVWASELGRVHLFDVTFGKGETVEIVHRYRYPLSGSVEGEEVYYVTKTGALWAGPIGRARFEVRVPDRPWSLAYPPDYALKTYQEKLNAAGKPETLIVFEMKDWTPTRDLYLLMGHFHTPLSRLGADCPQFFLTQYGGEDKKSFGAPLAKELAALSPEQLRLCRNLPYAHHGYPFKSEDLRALLYRAPATKKGLPFAPDITDDGAETWTYVLFQQNVGWTPKLLSREEQLYVKAVKTEERRRKAAK